MKILILFLLVSCANSKHLLKQKELLPYKESSQVTKLVTKNQPMQLVAIKDKRTIQHIGKAYTGVQYNETPIHLEVELKQMLRDYFTDAFEMRNITINEQGQLTLEIEVNKFWVEEVIEKFQPEKAKCHVDMTFHVNGTNKKWSGSFWTEFNSAGDLRDGTERIAPTLASCMNDIVEKVVNDTKFQEIIK